LPLAPPSSYVGELPNSHGRTLTDKSCVMHGIRTATINYAFCGLPPEDNPHPFERLAVYNCLVVLYDEGGQLLLHELFSAGGNHRPSESNNSR